MFESNSEMARITGTVKTDLRQTVLSTHIGFDELKLKVILGFILFTYVAVLAILFASNPSDELTWLPLLIVGHGLLIFGILTFVLRYQIRVSSRRFRQFLDEILAKASTEEEDADSDHGETLNLNAEPRKKKLFRK